MLSQDGAGQFISAGHTPVLLFRSASGQIEVLESDAYMLGMFTFSTYRPRRFQMDKGDVLVVTSDGLTKAENARNELFGPERPRETVERDAPAGAEAVERSLLVALEAFTQGISQADDMTFVIIEKHQ